MLYIAQGCHEEAEPLYIQAVKLFANLIGENHPNTETVWKNFAIFLQRVIDRNRTADLSNHPLTQTLLQSLQNSSD